MSPMFLEEAYVRAAPLPIICIIFFILVSHLHQYFKLIKDNLTQ